jgi:D-3-phosphoglycerate dehydrogenase
MARILISDKLSNEGIAILEAVDGFEVDHRPGLSPDELEKVLPDYDALIVRSGTKVTKELIEVAGKLRVIGRAGIGVDNIHLPTATARGVIVMNTPGGNTVTTAEHAIALMFSLARRIPQATMSIKAGKWEKSQLGGGKELFSQVLGVIGLGNIGSLVADRARGLHMRVIAFDPLVSEERAQRLGVDLVTLDELYAQADVITLHVPKTKDTTHMLSTEAFGKMKDGVLIVNAARGGVIDEYALAEAIQSGKVRGAALDVFETEPPPADHPLLACEQFIATPHLGASTSQAQLNVAIAVAEQIRDYLCDGEVRNAVNLPSVSAEERRELQPYIRLGEKLGLFQGQRCESIEEIDVEYAGEMAGLNVQSITLAVLKGLLYPWVGAEVNFVNAPHIAQQRGIRVIESKSAISEDFTSLLTVRLRSKDRELRVAGTLFGRTQPRIVLVDDFSLEAIPDGNVMLIHNEDRPGVVGKVGTLLGDANINISRMQLGLHPDGSEAVQLLNVAPEPGEELMETLKNIAGVKSVYLLDLGEGEA